MKIRVLTKIDWGAHLLPVNQADLENLQEILNQGGYNAPTMKLSIYKNRRGKYKGIYLWCNTNLGVCRVDPIFATRWDYTFLELEDVKLYQEEGE